MGIVFHVDGHDMCLIMKAQMSRSTPRRRFLNRYRFVCISHTDSLYMKTGHFFSLILLHLTSWLQHTRVLPCKLPRGLLVWRHWSLLQSDDRIVVVIVVVVLFYSDYFWRENLRLGCARMFWRHDVRSRALKFEHLTHFKTVFRHFLLKAGKKTLLSVSSVSQMCFS